MAHARKVHNPFASGGTGGGGGSSSGLTTLQWNAGGFRDHRYKGSSHSSRRPRKAVSAWSTAGFTVLVVTVFVLLRSWSNYSTSLPVAPSPASVPSSMGQQRIGTTTATSLPRTATPPPVPVIASPPPQEEIHPSPTIHLNAHEEGDLDSNYGEHLGKPHVTKDDDDQDEEDSDADGDGDGDADIDPDTDPDADTDADITTTTSPPLSEIVPPSILADPNTDPINQDDTTPVVQDDTINNTKPLNSEMGDSAKNTTNVHVNNTIPSEFNDHGNVSVSEHDGNDNTTTIPVQVAANSTNHNTTLPDIDANQTEIQHQHHHHSNENLTTTTGATIDQTVNATSDRVTPEGSMTGSNHATNSTHQVLLSNNNNNNNNNETDGISDASTNNGTIPIDTTSLLPPTVLSPNMTNATNTILPPTNTTWSDVTTKNVTNEGNGTIPIDTTTLLAPTVLSPNMTNATNTILLPTNTTWSDVTTKNVTNEGNGTIPIGTTTLLAPTVLSPNMTNATIAWSDVTTNNVTTTIETNATIPIHATMLRNPTESSPNGTNPTTTSTATLVVLPLNTTWSDTNETSATKIPINATMLLSPTELSPNATNIQTTRRQRSNDMHNNNNNTVDPTERSFSNTTEMTNSSTHTINTTTTAHQLLVGDDTNVTATSNLRGKSHLRLHNRTDNVIKVNR